MKTETVERLTLLNTGLLVVLVWKVFIAAEPQRATSLDSVAQQAQVNAKPLEKPDQPKSQEAPPSNNGAKNYEELLLQSIEPLERAYAEHGEEIAIPSETQLQAAIRTNSLKSEESKVVLEILEKGYERFNMPFPKLEIPTSRQSDSVTPQKNNAPENTQPPPFGEWLRRTSESLMTELKDKKESAAGLVPTEQQLQAAVNTGDPRSEDSRLAIDMLKNGYARLQLEFPEYGQIENSTGGQSEETDSKSMRQKVSQQRILKAYFQGQVQRLKLEATAKSTEIDTALPSDEDIEKAVVSGSLKTEQSKLVIAQIQSCYEQLGLTFYSPPTGD